MKKIFSYFFIINTLLIIIILTSLSTIGIKTDKFNNIISNKINEVDNNVLIDLTSINFKLDIKEISLFLETFNPKIKYRDVSIPAENIKVYIDFISLLKSSANIKKINLSLKELEIEELKKLIVIIKPSNFKSIINNKVKKGKIISNFEIFFNENNSINDFIAKGKVSDLKLQVTKEIFLEKTKFNFFADKSDILIKSIFSESDGIEIRDGDIQLQIDPIISVKSNFISNLRFPKKINSKYVNFLSNLDYLSELVSLEANLNNNITISFDKTYKVNNYNFESRGIINKADLNLKKNFRSNLLNREIKEISLINSNINSVFDSKLKNINISGKYSINKDDFNNFEIKNIINKNYSNLEIEVDYSKKIKLELINYKKENNIISNIFIKLKKQKNKIEIIKALYKEKKNNILLEDIKLVNNNLLSFKKISVVTFDDNVKNNDFVISYDKKIEIKGNNFDASNLSKFLNQKEKNNILSKITKEIDISINNTKAPLSRNLKNFKLIGLIQKGKFSKITAKGDFGNKQYLDISMENDNKNNKKYLEIYSDLPQPLLTQFGFFKGLSGGTLFYKSIILPNNSNSNLKIENFKVVSAPGLVKLLSLADLGGLADLAEGEGLSFDVLEIKIENNHDIMRFSEIFAVGPSISVLMEGYTDKNGTTSLRGTLIPARNLNKLISKIPVLGEIIIPKEIGEGLFGISFKMKGPPGKIKTTINPIKTLTPRFIQKIIERNKLIK